MVITDCNYSSWLIEHFATKIVANSQRLAYFHEVAGISLFKHMCVCACVYVARFPDCALAFVLGG